jgi:hypothetical protein
MDICIEFAGINKSQMWIDYHYDNEHYHVIIREGEKIQVDRQTGTDTLPNYRTRPIFDVEAHVTPKGLKKYLPDSITYETLLLIIEAYHYGRIDGERYAQE